MSKNIETDKYLLRFNRFVKNLDTILTYKIPKGYIEVKRNATEHTEKNNQTKNSE